MIKKAFLLLTLISLFSVTVSCRNETTNTGGNNDPRLRWMDRKIYFAFSNVNFPERNNEFQKKRVKDALNEIASLTMLGSGYFEYEDVDESLLQPINELTTQTDDFKSFVLIWPDVDFSSFVVDQLGGQVPDPNAVTVINAANKRKFFMIFRSSCFLSGALCNNITPSLGFRAMVARQLGLLVGQSIKDCNDFPNDVLCSSQPKDTQWSPDNKFFWINSFNNSLETILNTPRFYEEFIPPNSF